MSTPLVLQTLEFMSIIHGMDYFTPAERLSIFLYIGKEIIDDDLSECTENILEIHTIEAWEQTPANLQTLLQNICTHPAVSSALTKALYVHTNTPTAAPNPVEIANMQAEIEEEAKKQFHEWVQSGEQREEQRVPYLEEPLETTNETTVPNALPIPLDDENWDIGLVLYHPHKHEFHIHFLRSGKYQSVPCTEPSSIVHPNSYY